MDKERAGGLVKQVLTERELTVRSTADEGARFKSEPFKFESESQIRYQGSYNFQVVNGEIKVTITDIRFASGMPTLFPVPGALLASLSNPMQERLQALAAGTPMARASHTSAPPVVPASGDHLNQADILGIHLNMSAAQARKVLAGKGKWTERPLKSGIGNEYRQLPMTVGHFQYRCAGAGPCKVGDAIESMATYALPGQPDMVGIYRVRIFGANEKPLLNETAKALQDKYGRELFHTPHEYMGTADRYTMRWAANIPGGVRGDYSGLSPMDQRSATGCPIAYLPEAPMPEWGDPKTFYSANDIDANQPTINRPEFFTDVNRVLRKERPLAGCGTLLGVVLALDSNRDYVKHMRVSVLNYARLDAQLQALGSSFLKDADGARMQQLEKDKGRKPEL
ncbi:hypothetical protein [Ideonella margarita]|uniref:Uncharacterized protein n=1 Tax=Ideonella margarita TaxID=2984191 RepID=A0ABU9C4S7_9BURK